MEELDISKLNRNEIEIVILTTKNHKKWINEKLKAIKKELKEKEVVKYNIYYAEYSSDTTEINRLKENYRCLKTIKVGLEKYIKKIKHHLNEMEVD